MPDKPSFLKEIGAGNTSGLFLQHEKSSPLIPRSSPFYSNNTPRPSIEMDVLESDRTSGMFVTPDPDEMEPPISMSVSVKDSTPGASGLKSSKRQNSDGDCMIIDVIDCSPEAREEWLSSERENKNSSMINIEPGSGRARPQDLVKLQRKLIAQHNASKLRESGATTVFRSGNRRSDLIFPQKTKRNPQQGSFHDQESLNEPNSADSEFENLMGRDDDDIGWMGLTNDDGMEEVEKLNMLKRAFEARQGSEELSDLEMIKLTRLNQQIEIHKRREDAMNRSTILVSEDEDEDNNTTDHQLRKILYSEAAKDMREKQDGKKTSRATKKAAKVSKRKFPKSAREVEENRREKERQKQQKKQARTANSKTGPSKGKVSKSQNKRVRSTEIKPKSSIKDGSGVAMETFGAMLQDLVHNDFVADRQAQKDYGAAPLIQETTKEKALRALLASVPADYDTHKAKTDKKALSEASKRFGHGNVKSVEGKWKINGMKTPLYHHQLIGVDWMLTRELGMDEPYGGLLADAMGLGKTLQTLATMVGNPPSREQVKARTKATLIVLPSSAIRQWQLEIAAHVDSKIFPRVIHYKAKKEIPIISLRDFDIVLTSYAEVMASFPFTAFEDSRSLDTYDGVEKWLEISNDATGDLHKIHWYRVVLDEAHAIKNYKSRTSLACQCLRGTYRWVISNPYHLLALSGTPLQNGLDELFPYLRFLHAPWTKSFNDFCEHFCDPNAEDAMARISVILSIVMRRTIKDKILGRPIVELPPIHPDTHYVRFTSEERVLYRILEERFRDGLNRHLEKGTAERNYAVFLVQLLRLRQCTAHPFLLESTVKEFLNIEDVTRLKAEWKMLSGCKQPLYEQISQWMQRTEDEKAAMKAKGELALGSGEKQPFGASDFGKCFRMGSALESLNYKDLKKRVVCRLCGDLPTNALLTDCFHVFCRNCLENYLANETETEGFRSFDQCPEPSCRKVFKQASSYADLNLPDDEITTDDRESESVSDSESETYNRTGRRKRKRKSKSKKSKVQSSWYKACIHSEDKYLPPSAKTVALKAKILKWIDEAPNDKIIIFTQWRLMAKIVGRICEMEKWGFIYFNGEMNLDERHNSVMKFHADPEIKIMIAGLKCGGQALNLTCANRVISIDLWWNHSIEQQAFGRIFRIGQHKETYASRLVVRNSIDCRLLKLQAYKMETIDKALQDTSDSIVEPLSMRDLAGLFGHLREKKDGTLFVEPDYEPEDEGENRPDGETQQGF